MPIRIPFGKSQMMLNADLRNAEILESQIGTIHTDSDEKQIVLSAMDNPINSPHLRELAVGKKNCTILISDSTRPVPSQYIVPAMLSELREGNPDIDITLLVATGSHRPTRQEELTAKLGKEIVQREKIKIHHSEDASSNVPVGILPSGAVCAIDISAAQTDLLIAEGLIEPHFFAGFSGGSKSVLPGVSDQATIFENHCSEFIASPLARAGLLNANPLQKDIMTAGKLARLCYIVNVIVNEKKQVVAAFAGNPITAHRIGCEVLLTYCQVQPKQYGDIVISSNGGYPMDQNIYQSVKGLAAAAAAAAPDAVLIMVSACSEGAGGEHFYHDLRDCVSPQRLLNQILATPRNLTQPDQWESQILSSVLCKHHVIYVTEPAQKKTIEEMKMTWAPNVNAALQEAQHIKGEKAHLIVIPNGISVVVSKNFKSYNHSKSSNAWYSKNSNQSKFH